jgi:hypothetical protein
MLAARTSSIPLSALLSPQKFSRCSGRSFGLVAERFGRRARLRDDLRVVEHGEIAAAPQARPTTITVPIFAGSANIASEMAKPQPVTGTAHFERDAIQSVMARGGIASMPPLLFESLGTARLEHNAEKACLALDAGWVPVFGKHHAPTITQSGMAIRRKAVTL